VFVVGHVGWGSRYDLNATVTAGVISKLVSRHVTPVLLQVVCFADLSLWHFMLLRGELRKPKHIL